MLKMKQKTPKISDYNEHPCLIHMCVSVCVPVCMGLSTHIHMHVYFMHEWNEGNTSEW